MIANNFQYLYGMNELLWKNKQKAIFETPNL